MRASRSIAGLLVRRDHGMAVSQRELLPLGFLEIGADHLGDELRKSDFGLPAELATRLGRVTEQAVHLGRPEIPGVDRDDAAPLLVVPTLLRALALPGDADPELLSGGGDELANAVLLAGGDHEILGLVLLQHQPLRLDVLARVTPIALRVEVAEVQA